MGDTTLSGRSPTKSILRIQWPNAAHELLSKEETNDPKDINITNVAQISVKKPDGTRLSPIEQADPIKSKGGNIRFIDFEIDPTATPSIDEIHLSVEFRPRFKKRVFDNVNKKVVPSSTNFVQETVWSLKMKLVRGKSSGPKVLNRNGGEDPSNEDPTRFYVGEPLDGSAPWVDSATSNKTHQLVDWPSYSSSSGSETTTLLLFTEVVDVTELWKQLSEQESIKLFEKHVKVEQEQRTNGVPHYPAGGPWDALRILAHTGLTAGNLFAVFIPTKARDSKRGDVGAVVMFTPGYNMYDSVTEAREGNRVVFHLQYNLNRYLLQKKRIPDLDPDIPQITTFKDYVCLFTRKKRKTDKPPPNDESIWITIPIGQASSVETSGKNVIFVIPFANGKGYPLFAETNHQETLAAALRFLWTHKRVAKGHDGKAPALGREALAGFSHGGGELFKAIEKNAHASEIYAFDPNPAPGGGKFLFEVLDKLTWLKNKDRIFCLTAGLVNYMGDELGKLDRFAKAHPNQILLHPLTNRFWGPFAWPDPDDNGTPPPPAANPAENPDLGQEWLRCIRPTKDPDKAPLSVLTSEQCRADLLEPARWLDRPAEIVPTREKGAEPLPYVVQLAIINPQTDPKAFDPARDGKYQKNIAHQFAAFGGGLLKTRAGEEVFSDYLTCFLKHWSRFQDD